MKKIALSLSTLFAIGAIALVGCPAADKDHDDGDHSHDDEAHMTDESEGGGHTHGSGPHDGTLADWGGGAFHVEFTVDHDKQEATVYLLGDDEKSPAPIKAEEIQLSIKDPEMQVTLKAAPQQDDPEGSASRFVGNHESLGVVMEYAGTITGVVDGTPYTGDFIEEPHDEGGH